MALRFLTGALFFVYQISQDNSGMNRIKFSAVANATIATSFVVGWWYRPMADEGAGIEGPKRTNSMSKFNLAEVADEPRPPLYQLASQLVLLTTTAAARTFLFYMGECKIKQDQHYDAFLGHVLGRRDKTPLITVSNHRSLLDDPAIMSGILPLWMAVQEKYNRFSICSQEFCCSEKLPSAMHAYTGMGKVFPIRRGGGINQKLLLDYARLVAAGEWCHVFPEGGIWQTDKLGGRKNGTEDSIGKLKWGVGKLIAHAPVTPHVVPFFFMGTEHFYPQHPETKAVKNKLPIPGHNVNIRFGAEIVFDDLISEHEKVHGPLWKYRASVKHENNAESEDFHAYWDSKPSDLLLYGKITARIEEALNKLNDEHHQEVAVVAKK